MIRTALGVLARCWPALAAWFLAGWTARELLVRLAGFLGKDDGFLGLLVLPLAILAQLAAYVGMFLAVRRALPHTDQIDEAVDAAAPGRRMAAARRMSETLLSAILPFFIVYVAWNLVRDDLEDYTRSALEQADFGEQVNALDVPLSVMTITIIGVALAVRWLLGRFRDRLPAWTGGFAAYVEAVWVLTLLLVVQDLLSGVPEWIASRRMFAWAVDTWDGILDAVPWLTPLWDGIEWVIGQFGVLVALPLAWLGVAAIIYIRTATQEAASERTERLRRRWRRLPRWTRTLLLKSASSTVERWQPVADAARLIVRSGPFSVGLYILAFAIVQASGDWITFGAYRLLGPHETGWWYGASDLVGLGVATVVGVLQIAIVAAAFDHSVKRSTTGDSAGDEISTTGASRSPAGTR